MANIVPDAVGISGLQAGEDVKGKITYDRFLDVVGTPALPLIAWWARGKQ